MESIKTARRIHPLMAAAAVSVVIVSLAGTAAITGLLPTSHGAPAPALSAIPAAPLTQVSAAEPQFAAAPQQYAPAQPYSAEPDPAPAIRHAAPHHKVVHHHHTQVARNDYQQNDSAPVQQQAAAPAQPNYVGIGVGAVVGGLLGHQVGGGNGKKLATVAGVIGGGMLGNQIANGNR
ncbi:MAG TPA: glycine zipper 2TM domain-containing protein [Telluria sp.]|nr:glycine zipper 2TM domain-containing protein [Telluria sp.]